MSESTPNRGSRVLVIEEGKELSTALAPAAKQLPFNLVLVGSGFDGLEAAREGHCDLIVLHLSLKDLDGLEVLRRMRRSRRLREIPVLAVAAADAEKTVQEAVDLGAVACLRAPIDPDDLTSRVTTLLKHQAASERAAPPDTEQRLRTRDDLLSLNRIFENVSDAVWVMEPDARVQSVNPPFERLFGLQLADLREPGAVARLFTAESQWPAIWESVRKSGTWTGEVGMTGAGGVPITVHLRVLTVREEVAGVLGVVALATNLTQRKQMEQDLLFYTDRDPLTGLWNRKSFGEILHRAVADARGGVGSFLLFLDLDHFRVVNSTMGSPTGDRLLKEVARLLRESLRRGDEVGRYGSDEFAILLRKVDQTQAVDVSRRLLRKLDSLRYTEDGRTFSANSSIGLAAIDGSTAGEEIFARAHSACHEVKNRGRNDLTVWSAESRELQRLAADSTWSIRLREAMRTNQMEIWLQPILPLFPAQSKVWFEVLLRMIGPDGNLILPGEFLPAAERFGNMLQIDEFALRQAVALMAQHTQFNLSINLSARSLKEEDLASRVARQFQDARIDPTRVAFEVTETTMIQDLIGARKILLELRQLGCAIFLDDFGSGASSMTYLRDLPVDVLKIDGSFFHTVDADQTSRTLVKTMNEMAHTLNKVTVAEHVMSASVLRIARELQIDYAQGWFVCEPARPAEFLERGMSRLSLFAP